MVFLYPPDFIIKIRRVTGLKFLPAAELIVFIAGNFTKNPTRLESKPESSGYFFAEPYPLKNRIEKQRVQ